MNSNGFCVSGADGHGGASDVRLATFSTRGSLFSTNSLPPGESGVPSGGLVFGDDEQDGGEVLRRLLEEVNKVGEGDDETVSVIDTLTAAAEELAPLSATVPYGPSNFLCGTSPCTTPFDTTHTPSTGGFVVEGTSPTPYSQSVSRHSIPPPAYHATEVASMGSQTPYNRYVSVPHGSGVKPPPSFAEAIASTTPLSMMNRPSPMDLPSVMAQYVPPLPAASQDTILLRNVHGVFLLKSVVKPPPVYTPPAATTSPPVSPIPRYSLPPSAAPLPAASSHFLGPSVMQGGGYHTAVPSHVDPPDYNSAVASGAAVSPPFSSAAVYTPGIASLRGTPQYSAAPPSSLLSVKRVQ